MANMDLNQQRPPSPESTVGDLTMTDAQKVENITSYKGMYKRGHLTIEKIRMNLGCGHPPAQSFEATALLKGPRDLLIHSKWTCTHMRNVLSDMRNIKKGRADFMDHEYHDNFPLKSSLLSLTVGGGGDKHYLMRSQLFCALFHLHFGRLKDENGKDRLGSDGRTLFYTMDGINQQDHLWHAWQAEVEKDPYYQTRFMSTDSGGIIEYRGKIPDRRGYCHVWFENTGREEAKLVSWFETQLKEALKRERVSPYYIRENK